MRFVMLPAGMALVACSTQGGAADGGGAQPDVPTACPAAPTDHPRCPIGGHTSLCPVRPEWIPSCADGHCYECQGTAWSLTFVDCICPDAGAADAH